MQAEKVLSRIDGLPRLERIVTLDDSLGSNEMVAPLAAFVENRDDRAIAVRIAKTRAFKRDVPATLLYTSGTTGTPKGVLLTHGNLVGTVEASVETRGDLRTIDVALRVLPLSHALERVAGHLLTLYYGGTAAQIRSYDTIADDFRILQPNYAPLVPRIYEKIHAAILARVAASPAWKRWLFDWAMRTGRERGAVLERGDPVPKGLEARYLVADRLVLHRLRGIFGGKIDFLGSGGAPISVEVLRFFHSMGLLICEAWGATETSAPATSNTSEAFRFGSVGRPLPGVEVRVADDGELLVRGVNVFGGYYRDPEATAAAFDEEGFYRTGDIGRIDEDGFVYITDRKKEIIITAAGKNIAPQKLENLARSSPFVSNCFVSCDRRPYVVALVTLDRAAIAAVDCDLAIAGSNDPNLRRFVERQIDAANAQLARFEQIKQFRILDRDFSPESGELTLTLKLKRRVIASNYGDLIEEMYATGIPDTLPV